MCGCPGRNEDIPTPFGYQIVEIMNLRTQGFPKECSAGRRKRLARWFPQKEPGKRLHTVSTTCHVYKREVELGPEDG